MAWKLKMERIIVNLSFYVHTTWLQGDSGGCTPGLGWLWFGSFHCPSLGKKRNLAESARQLGKLVEHPNQSVLNPSPRQPESPCIIVKHALSAAPTRGPGTGAPCRGTSPVRRPSRTTRRRRCCGGRPRGSAQSRRHRDGGLTGFEIKM